MKNLNFYIDRYDWAVFVLYSVGSEDKQKVKETLEYFNCPSHKIKIALDNLDTLDNGFIFNNPNSHLSVILIGEVSKGSELMNTIIHEGVHLIRCISNYYELSEEECATFVGDYTMKICDKMHIIYNSL